MTFSTPLTNPWSTHCSICRIRYAFVRQRAGRAKYRGEQRGAYRHVIPQSSRSHSLHFVKQRGRRKMSFPRDAGAPFSPVCFPSSAINRPARGGGLNWIYLAVHVRDISTDVSAANHWRSCAGVSKEPTFSLNGKPPATLSRKCENALASFI